MDSLDYNILSRPRNTLLGTETSWIGQVHVTRTDTVQKVFPFEPGNAGKAWVNAMEKDLGDKPPPPQEILKGIVLLLSFVYYFWLFTSKTVP